MDEKGQRLNENLWPFCVRKNLLSYTHTYFPHKKEWRTDEIQYVVFIKCDNTIFRNHMEKN